MNAARALYLVGGVLSILAMGITAYAGSSLLAILSLLILVACMVGFYFTRTKRTE